MIRYRQLTTVPVLMVFALLSTVGDSSRCSALVLTPAPRLTDEEVEILLTQRFYQGITDDDSITLMSLFADQVSVNGNLVSRVEAISILRSEVLGLSIKSKMANEQQTYIFLSGFGYMPGPDETSVEAPGFDEANTRANQPDSEVKHSEVTENNLWGLAIDFVLDGKWSSLKRQPLIVEVDISLETKTIDEIHDHVPPHNVLSKVAIPKITKAPDFMLSDVTFFSTSGTGYHGNTYIHRPVYPGVPGYTPRLTRSVVESSLGGGWP